MSNYITTKQFCEMYNFNMKTLRKFIALKALPYYKIGGKIFFKESEIDRWFGNQKVV